MLRSFKKCSRQDVTCSGNGRQSTVAAEEPTREWILPFRTRINSTAQKETAYALSAGRRNAYQQEVGQVTARAQAGPLSDSDPSTVYVQFWE